MLITEELLLLLTKPEGKALYQAQAKGARDELQKDWRGSSLATKAP